ncbi:DUF6114 domain-containing protein [Actinosynnema sp. NPDC050436]|uniref:DUF6114 domain-containing protein n=1 Tax=Actinosynnema sp. NPDC050436 TaxID=3155659 RepID=UPI0033D4C7D5
MGSGWRRAGRVWRRFTYWRRSRPFAAGVLLLLSSAVIALPPYATFQVGDLMISITTMGGVSALLIGTLLAVCGLSLWLRPQFRFAAGVTSAILSLVALVVTNLGGFLVGTFAGLTGAALALAWTDQPKPPRRPVLHVGVVLLLAMTPATGAGTTNARDTPLASSWTVTASTVRLDGVVYHGIERIVVNGRPVETMRFTAERVEADNPVQTADLGDGHRLTIATAGHATTAFAASVELFALRLTGVVSVLGLIGIPVDFTPAHPPPLVPPSVVLTDVTAVNALTSAVAITVPDGNLTVR